MQVAVRRVIRHAIRVRSDGDLRVDDVIDRPRDHEGSGNTREFRLAPPLIRKSVAVRAVRKRHADIASGSDAPFAAVHVHRPDHVPRKAGLVERLEVHRRGQGRASFPFQRARSRGRARVARRYGPSGRQDDRDRQEGEHHAHAAPIGHGPPFLPPVSSPNKGPPLFYLFGGIPGAPVAAPGPGVRSPAVVVARRFIYRPPLPPRAAG